MLDRTQPDENQNAGDIASDGVPEHVADDKPAAQVGGRCWLTRAGQYFFALSFSSLTRRIVSLNLAGLVALVASILYLSQFRAGLIDARAQSLLVQAEIIAGAIGASATVQTNAITVDPDRLLDLKLGDSYGEPDDYSALNFPINPERVAPRAAHADLADQDPRADLRPQRDGAARQPRPRERADLPAAAAIAEARRDRARPDLGAPLDQPR